MREVRQGRHSINKNVTAVLVCLLVEVWVKIVRYKGHNLVSGSPNWWMRCVGTGILLCCPIPQARMNPISPWTAVYRAQPSPKLLFFSLWCCRRRRRGCWRVDAAADARWCRRLLELFRRSEGKMSPWDGNHQFVAVIQTGMDDSKVHNNRQ